MRFAIAASTASLPAMAKRWDRNVSVPQAFLLDFGWQLLKMLLLVLTKSNKMKWGIHVSGGMHHSGETLRQRSLQRVK